MQLLVNCLAIDNRHEPFFVGGSFFISSQSFSMIYLLCTVLYLRSRAIYLFYLFVTCATSPFTCSHAVVTSERDNFSIIKTRHNARSFKVKACFYRLRRALNRRLAILLPVEFLEMLVGCDSRHNQPAPLFR